MRRMALLVALVVLVSPGASAVSFLPGAVAPASAAAADATSVSGVAPEERIGVHVAASRSVRPREPSRVRTPPGGNRALAVSDRLHVDPLAVIGVTAVHRANVTGRNVTVGVIDTGFRSSYPAVAGTVDAYREFDTPGGWRHGTAVAGTVAAVAPDASLHLAAVGPRVSPEEYRTAVEWLLASGADVVVDAGSYHTQPGDGSGPISRVAARAAERAVFVTSVGNHAGGYWRGVSNGSEWVTFGDGSVEGNPLGGSAGPIRATLRWASPADDYGLYLFRKRPGRDALVASARSDGERYTTLAAGVPPGDYYLAVRMRDAADGAATASRNATANATASALELVVNRDLAYHSRARPSAPATAPGVLAVGAVHHEEARPFSVPGADIVAPDRPAVDLDVEGGTSMAAPYVAGAAALTVAANPAIEPATVHERLLVGARDLGPEGSDPLTGYGLVDAEVAIRPPATYPPRIWPIGLDGRVTGGYTETLGRNALGAGFGPRAAGSGSPGRASERGPVQ